jgi:hypothetical protein
MIATGASAAALLVRYVNVAFILAAAIALILFDRSRSISSRVRRAVIFTVVAGAPTTLFAAWARLDGGGYPTSKIYSFSGGALAPLDKLGDYLLPSGGPHALRFIAVLVMLTLVVGSAVWGPRLPGAQPEEDGDARSLLQLALVHLGAYLLFVIAVVAFFDLAVPIDARIFAPIRGLWYAVFFAAVYRLLARVATSVGTVAIVAAFTALLVATNWSYTRPVLDDGPSIPYARTSVADAISRIPRNALIVSNAPDAVYSLTGRDSIALPFLSGSATPAYERQMHEVIDLFQSRGGYLALNWFPWNHVSVPPELRPLGLRLIARGPVRQPTAELYEIPPKAAEQPSAPSG